MNCALAYATADLTASKRRVDVSNALLHIRLGGQQPQVDTELKVKKVNI